jgi:hypothetical protein
MTPPIAHAGHWITGIAYFLPVIAFLVWLGITQIRELTRRSSALTVTNAIPSRRRTSTRIPMPISW